MGCSIKGDANNSKIEESCQNGLIKGHAYGIMDIVFFKPTDWK